MPVAIRTHKQAILLSFILNRNILGRGFPRQVFALPRNDVPGGAVQAHRQTLEALAAAAA